MIGMGSSPGAPRSSIMFLMSMERSAILRSVKESAWCLATMGQDSRGRIPVTISTLSLEMSLTCCSPSEDMVVMADLW